MRFKKPITRSGPWLLVQSEVVELVSKWPEEFTVTKNDMSTLFHAAIYPEDMAVKERSRFPTDRRTTHRLTLCEPEAA